MGLVTLTEILKESVEKKYAVGAFDTLDDNFTEAIVAAAEEEGLPVILMVPNFFADDRDERQMSFYFNRLLDRCQRRRFPSACIWTTATASPAASKPSTAAARRSCLTARRSRWRKTWPSPGSSSGLPTAAA